MVTRWSSQTSSDRWSTTPSFDRASRAERRSPLPDTFLQGLFLVLSTHMSLLLGYMPYIGVMRNCNVRGLHGVVVRCSCTLHAICSHGGKHRHLQSLWGCAGVAVNCKPLEIAHYGVCDFLGNRKPLENRTPPHIIYYILTMETQLSGS